MQLIVRGRNVPVSSALHQHCSSKVERALHRLDKHVHRAEVILLDLNGPRAGGSACRLLVDLWDGRRLTVESRENDFYSAAGQASARLGHLVVRELERSRTRGRANHLLKTRRSQPFLPQVEMEEPDGAA